MTVSRSIWRCGWVTHHGARVRKDGGEKIKKIREKTVDEGGSETVGSSVEYRAERSEDEDKKSRTKRRDGDVRSARFSEFGGRARVIYIHGRAAGSYRARVPEAPSRYRTLPYHAKPHPPGRCAPTRSENRSAHTACYYYLLWMLILRKILFCSSTSLSYTVLLSV